jgi:hypothetical protein
MRLCPLTSGATLPSELLGTWQVASYLTMEGDQADTQDLWQIEADHISTPDQELEIESLTLEQAWDKESYLLSFADSPVQYLLLASEQQPDHLLVRAFFEGNERLRFLLTRLETVRANPTSAL